MTTSKAADAGWQIAPLGELFEIRDRDRIPVNADERAHRRGPVPYYGATGQVGWIDDFIFDEELILLGEDGAPFLQGEKPKAYVIRGKTWVNNHAHVLRALASSPSAFWKYQLDQVDFHGFVSGTTRLKLPQGPMRKMPLLVPPLPEQYRIVEALESYFTRLDDAVATLERVQRNLKRYRASVLKAAVEGRLVPTEAELARAEGRGYEPAPVLLQRILAERRRCWEEAELAKLKARGKTPKDDKWKAKYVEPAAPDTTDLPELPEGWCWASVDQVCSHIVDCPHSTPKWVDDGYVCVRTTEFLRGRLLLDRVRFVSRSTYEERIKRLRPAAGDILYSREGGILGIACQVPLGVELCLGQRMMLMRAASQTQARFLMHVLNSPRVLSTVAELTGGSASPHLNVGDIKSFPVPLPPEAETFRIVDAIDDVLSIADSIKHDAGINLGRCSRLRQSILKWAFEGRLVDQDPSDEPASRLLERIRTEREAERGGETRSSRRRQDPHA